MHYQVYVVGEAGIQLELKQAGISYIGGPVLLSPLPVLPCLCPYHRYQSTVHLVFISVIILNSLFTCYGGCAKKHAKSEGFYLIVGCVIGLLDFQEDGDKKIDLAPGHFMEHDQDV
jgi:hypothetical protein